MFSRLRKNFKAVKGIKMMRLSHYINGLWCNGQGEAHPVINPYTGNVNAHMPLATAAEVESAIDAAQRAFAGWSQTCYQERSCVLDQIADGFQCREAHVARLISQSMGKPLVEAQMDVADAIACYRYYADFIRDRDAHEGDEKPVSDSGFAAIRVQAPVGPVGLIVPWNFPTVTTAWKVAPALAAGCTVVLKPSELAPAPELVLAEICHEIGLPSGVINLVLGEAAVGQHLVDSDRLKKISFTGSTRVGQSILAASADTLKNISLELGGKSSLIVTEDADIELAAQLAINGLFFNAGQMCSATSRVLVHSALYPAFQEVLKAKASALVLGDPMDDSTQMGPLSGQKQYETVTRYLAIAKAESLTCLTGGTPSEGLFVPPTVFVDVPRTSRLWNEEIFGPVLCVASFDQNEEAIEHANDSEFGLAATVVSSDHAQAVQMANQLNAGIIWINTDQVVLPELSWGGFNKSGIGRELGESGFASFTELKHIVMQR
jgi:betaine-aldehyde dehydrogenase